MIVKELKRLLSNYPDDMEVVLDRAGHDDLENVYVHDPVSGIEAIGDTNF